MRTGLKAIALCLCMAGVSNGFAADPNPLVAMKKDKMFQTLGPALHAMTRTAPLKLVPHARVTEKARVNQLFRFDRERGCAVVDVVAAQDTEALVSLMEEMGMQNMTSYGPVVSGCITISDLESVAASELVHFARPAAATTHVGLVTTQGDRSMRTDEVRDNLGVDGRGVRVGILSDSFECLQGPLFEGNPFTTVTQDITNDDLPPDVVILSDSTSEDCTDEGRAILQLVHDVAPGAAGAFHTASNGQADFAKGILELAYQAGSDVIVDDVIYFAEPMFADGIIAQAADTVKSWGIPYFSAAGNNARDSYESEFRPSGDFGLIGERHDFDPNKDSDPLQWITVGADGVTVISFQWDEPYFTVSGEPGAASDLDFLFYFDDDSPVDICNPDGLPVVCQIPGTADSLGGDPVEVIAISNGLNKPINVNISIELFSGPAPKLIKYVVFGRSGFTPNEFDTQSPTIYGHSNAAGAEAVGAATFSQTEEYPQPDPLGLVDVECIPACLNDFSSAGGVPILFDQEGNRLAAPEIRLKPGITGPDGGNTTFFSRDNIRDGDEFPNFLGTSASAPHVAAATALAISARGEGLAQDGRFRLCKPEDNENVQVEPSKALALLNTGARFRDCEELQPDDYLDALRATAQDMSLRVFSTDRFPPERGGGTAVAVPEVPDAPQGFDFDTGFGFIDAEEFFEAVAELD